MFKFFPRLALLLITFCSLISYAKEFEGSVTYKVTIIPKNKSVKVGKVKKMHGSQDIFYYKNGAHKWVSKGIDFQYTIIGDGSEKESLVFEIYQLGLTENVKLTGIIPSDKIAEYYKQNSIYLQPSVQEGFCNSVLEAQAAGMLCIVSDAEGLGENVLNKQTGWVIPKRDATAIADAVLYAHNLTEAGKKQITDNAQARVLREFTLEKQTKEFIDFYSN